MRKLQIAALSIVAVFYLILAEFGGSVDKTASIATVPQPEVGSSIMKVENGDPDLSSPMRIPDIAASSSRFSPRSDGIVVLPLTTELDNSAAADLDERIAPLLRLADHNKAQLYAVLLQMLEAEEIEDAGFREFILATFEEFSDYGPGEVLAALVRSAPTPALQISALRLLAEASQELSIDLFNQALKNPDPAIRRFAHAFFDEISAKAMMDAVTDAVLDREQAVRLVAFSTLEEMHGFTPVWEVAELVLNDPDPKIRKRALELLTYGDHRMAIDRLALALDDPNPDISDLARALLAELEQEPS